MWNNYILKNDDRIFSLDIHSHFFLKNSVEKQYKFFMEQNYKLIELKNIFKFEIMFNSVISKVKYVVGLFVMQQSQ